MNFKLGELYVTGKVNSILNTQQILELYIWHKQLKAGLLDEEDQEANRQAIRTGGRILSAYNVDQQKYYVITEADRSSTTILLAEEY